MAADVATRQRHARVLARPFTGSLLLPRVFAGLFGVRYDVLLSVLAGADRRRDSAGYSGFARSLGALSSTQVSWVALSRWDAALGRHEARMRTARAAHAAMTGGDTGVDFRLTHFQWLACLIVEWHLEGLKESAGAHVARIEAYRREQLPQISQYTAADARKLACFMATGAGKTLVMHVNLLQFLAHGLFEPANILLLTPPGDALAGQHAVELETSGLAGEGVRVAWITRFFIDDAGAKRAKRGVTEGTSRYEGPNLLLVDEGHKGGRGEESTERQWRAIRERLHAGGLQTRPGFTFEYSATFAQIADGDAELYDEYARCVSVDFGYARFWREGFGKQPLRINAKSDDASDLALTAGILGLYQQLLAFAQCPDEARDYRIAAPLAACVGREVTARADSDVVVLVRFLARAASDATWLAERLTETLKHMPAPQGALALQDGALLDFAYVRQRIDAAALTPLALAADVQARIFGGAGAVTARQVSDREIGLTCAGAATDAYFGVLRVGEAKKLFALLVGHAGVIAGESDKVMGSLFDRLDHDSKLTVLIGAKMFVEGWSSWRVSALGLMNVGTNRGSEIVQLFGRGVRLRGRDFSLKRDAAAPLPVRVLQSLVVFGVRADYLDHYLKTLDIEGMKPRVLHVPVRQTPDPIDKIGLQTLASDNDPFRELVVFDGGATRKRYARIDSAIEVAEGMGEVQAAGAPMMRLALGADWIEPEIAMQHALAIKRANRWGGLMVTPVQLSAYLVGCTIEAPQGWFADPGQGIARRAQAALEALGYGLAAAMRDAERRWRMLRLTVTPLTQSNAGLPWNEIDGEKRLAWRVEIQIASGARDAVLEAAREQIAQGLRPPEFLDRLMALLHETGESLAGLGERIAELLQDHAQLGSETLGLPLPRLYIPQHLYAPLLAAEAPRVMYQADPGTQLALFGGDAVSVPMRISPPALNAGETKFLWDVRAWWQSHCNAVEWRGWELAVLRNPAAGGLMLFHGEGFAPDFMLWLRRGERQALALVDPKGLAREWPDDKLLAISDLEGRGLSVPVRGFLVSATSPGAMALPPGVTPDLESLRARRVLLQHDPNYVETIADALRDACAQARTAESEA